MSIKLLLASLLVVASCNIQAVERITLDGKNFLEIADQNDRVLADNHFDNAEYEKAFNIYTKLALIGDKFSQYRISLHYYNGLFVEKDIAKAYAWANVAKEDGKEKIKQYYQELKSQLSEAQIDTIEDYRQVIFQTHSNMAVLKTLKRFVYKSLPKCISSHIRGNCFDSPMDDMVNNNSLRATTTSYQHVKNIKRIQAYINSLILKELDKGRVRIIEESPMS